MEMKMMKVWHLGRFFKREKKRNNHYALPGEVAQGRPNFSFSPTNRDLRWTVGRTPQSEGMHVFSEGRSKTPIVGG